MSTQNLENNKISISFIIPVYNTNVTMLERCIQSVLKLENDDIEIIIINDGSTEVNTNRYLEKCSKIKKIIVINKENEGPAVARNVGLDYAKGEYIVFLDSDDMIVTNAFRKIIEILNDNADVDILYHSFDVMDEYSNTIRKGSNTNDILSFSCLNSNRTMMRKIVKSLNFKNEVIWSKIYKKSIMSDIRFDPELKYCEDSIFNSEINNVASKFLGIYISAYIHFENTESLCHKYNSNASKDFSKSVKKLIEQLDDLSDMNQFYKAVIFHFYLEQILVLQVFNNENPSAFISRCRQAEDILYNEPFVQALKNIQVKDFSTREKVVYKFLKLKLIWFAYKLYFFHRKK